MTLSCLKTQMQLTVSKNLIKYDNHQHAQLVTTLFRGGGCDQITFWTTDDRELIFDMVIDIYKLFWKIEKEIGWKYQLCVYDVIIMQRLPDFRPNQAQIEVQLNRLYLDEKNG